MNNIRVRLLLAAALALNGCGSKQPQAPLKYSVVRFENLTPDRSLDWVGRAASEVLTAALGAVPQATMYQAQQPSVRRPASAPGISTETSGAELAGATRIISGYYELVKGKLVVTAVEEDPATGKTLKTVSAAGAILPSMDTIARRFTGTPKKYSTANEAALRDAMTAVESPAQKESLFRKAVAEDPNYTEAYAGWAEIALARRDSATIEEILKLARAHKLDPVIVAKLELAAANLGTDPAARERALAKLAAADPSDKGVMRGVADAEFAAHRYAEAATHYAQAADPAHPDIYNVLAYTKMFAGDEQGALQAIGQFQKLQPNDPNAIDTQGDIECYFGRLGEAEKTYFKAAAKDPKFNQGTELWKAARARLLTGDVAGANGLFNNYRDTQLKANDVTIPFRSATWTYLAGARIRGMAEMLKAAGAEANPQIKTLELAQASIWEIQMGKKEEAIRDAELVIRAGQNPSIVPAAMARFTLAQPAGSAEEWRQRAEKAFNGAGVEQVRTLAVAYALYLSGHYAEAAQAWKGIYNSTIPNEQAAAFFYAGALHKSGREQEAVPLLKGNPIPSANLAATFESYYFPEFLDWRGDRTTFRKLLPAGTEAPAK